MARKPINSDLCQLFGAGTLTTGLYGRWRVPIYSYPTGQRIVCWAAAQERSLTPPLGPLQLSQEARSISLFNQF